MEMSKKGSVLMREMKDGERKIWLLLATSQLFSPVIVKSLVEKPVIFRSKVF